MYSYTPLKDKTEIINSKLAPKVSTSVSPITCSCFVLFVLVVITAVIRPEVDIQYTIKEISQEKNFMEQEQDFFSKNLAETRILVLCIFNTKAKQSYDTYRYTRT